MLPTGRITNGEIGMELFVDQSQATLQDIWGDFEAIPAAARDAKILMPDDEEIGLSGWYKSFGIKAELSDGLKGDLSFLLADIPDWPDS